MPESWISQPPKPSQNFSARSLSCAGNSTCTIFLPMLASFVGSPPFRRTLYAQPMVRAIVLYDDAPDPARYAAHAELCRKVPVGTFRHGRVFGSPMGEPEYGYF